MLIARFARGAVLALLAAAPTAKAADCPVIALVAPFPAGSTTDTIARALAKDMGRQLATAIVVENKPGAEGQIAALDVLKAKPDGCRLLFATSGNLSIAPHIRRQPPYEVHRDFTTIADVGRYTYLLYTNASFPARNYAEFVAEVKRKPGQYNYGTGSNTNLMAFAHLSQKSGLEMTRVPFKGEPPPSRKSWLDACKPSSQRPWGFPTWKAADCAPSRSWDRGARSCCPTPPRWPHWVFLPWTSCRGPDCSAPPACRPP